MEKQLDGKPQLRIRTTSNGHFVPEVFIKKEEWTTFKHPNFKQGSRPKEILWLLKQSEYNRYIKEKELGYSDTKVIFFENKINAYAFLGMIVGISKNETTKLEL